MIPHRVQKKRVIVMDCDITFPEDVWKKIMRHVLGRHFADLRGNGPGWSFSQTHLETFCLMVNEKMDEATVSDGEKSVVITKTQTTTCSEPVEATVSDGEKSVVITKTQTTTCSEPVEATVPDGEKSVAITKTQTTTCSEQEEEMETTFSDGEKSVASVETQTCSKLFSSEKGNKTYKFDIDDQIRLFVDQWSQKVNFLV